MVIAAVLLVPLFVFAQQNSNANQVQAQNQVSNPDAGVASTERIQEEVNSSKPEYSPRSETAKSHMSEVATAVESLVRVGSRIPDAGIGDQVREIAKAQGESEDKVNKALDKASERKSAVKFFLGADYKQLKEVKKEMEQNRLRIQELQKLMLQVTDEADKTELQSQISTLEAQNTLLQDRVESETDGFSLMGWLFKLIYKY